MAKKSSSIQADHQVHDSLKNNHDHIWNSDVISGIGNGVLTAVAFLSFLRRIYYKPSLVTTCHVGPNRGMAKISAVRMGASHGVDMGGCEDFWPNTILTHLVLLPRRISLHAYFKCITGDWRRLIHLLTLIEPPWISWKVPGVFKISSTYAPLCMASGSGLVYIWMLQVVYFLT